VKNILNDKVNIINDLCDKLNLETYFTITIHSKNSFFPVMKFPKSIISFASSINADVVFDLYDYSESDYDLLEKNNHVD
jgi:hypothetical protein